ncbi:hypothetical protein HOD88_01920 [archaeon]|jgi:hypothetical protein|nr:hypothetical protein [archaeon]
MLNETIFAFSPEMIDTFESLVSSIKALGIAIIFYIGFSIVNAVMNRRKEKEMKEINNNLKEIKNLMKKKSKK